MTNFVEEAHLFRSADAMVFVAIIIIISKEVQSLIFSFLLERDILFA